MKPGRTTSARLLATVLVTLAALTLFAHQSTAAPTPAQQAAANARLTGLWTNTQGNMDRLHAAKITVAQVRAALNQGADPNARDTDGNTALMLSCLYSSADCARLLISRGADVNAKCDYVRQTALMLAANHGNADCVKVLVSSGADVNARDRYDETPLIDAAVGGNVDCVKYIVPKAAINAKDQLGMTALMWAVSFRRVAVVKFLISKGADVNARSNNGKTPLTMAETHKRPDIVAILKAAGAK